MKTKILDCTIRDGGHINKWTFTDECVRASYFAALKSGVDYFEIGYKTQPSVSAPAVGPYGVCEDAYLASVITPNNKCKIAIMMDAGKVTAELLKDRKASGTCVSAVRVAAYPYELEKAFALVENFHEKGYEVFMNLMASSELSAENYLQLKNWSGKSLMQCVAFADSFGSFLPKDISDQFSKLREAGFERIGYHAHNNLQMAFANTLQAISEGAYCVDASAYGMGRGAGNLPIEVLLSYLAKQEDGKYNPVPYLDVVDRFYAPLSKKYEWGYGLSALISGVANVHPYYVDALFLKKAYTVDEIFNAAEYVKKKCPVSYSIKDMDGALQERLFRPGSCDIGYDLWRDIDRHLITDPELGSRVKEFSGAGLHKGRKFLILANGPSILKYKDEINEFAKKNNCVTIGLNYLQGLYKTDYHAFVSKKRFLKYVSTVAKETCLLLPDYFDESMITKSTNNKFIAFPIRESLGSDTPVNGTVQQCAYLNVAISAALSACLMGASEIFVAGMDGYLGKDGEEVKYFYNENDVPEKAEDSSKMYAGLADELRRAADYMESKGVPFAIMTPTSHKKYYRNVLVESV